MPSLNQDQKRALYIAGGVAVVAIALMLSRKSLVPPGSDVQPGIPAGTLGYDNSPPAYTSFNVQPLKAPPSIIPAPRLPAGVAGCGCQSGNDGCFTSDPNGGSGPISLDQLLARYAGSIPDFRNLIAYTQSSYDVAPGTVIEQTSPFYPALGSPIYNNKIALAGALGNQVFY